MRLAVIVLLALSTAPAGAWIARTRHRPPQVIWVPVTGPREVALAPNGERLDGYTANLTVGLRPVMRSWLTVRPPSDAIEHSSALRRNMTRRLRSSIDWARLDAEGFT